MPIKLPAMIVRSLRFGNGVQQRAKVYGQVAIDPPNAAAGAVVKPTFTLTGAAVGDIVHMIPPDALENTLYYGGCRVTAANTVTVYIRNASAGAVDGVSLNWNYVWEDLT